MTEAGTAVHVHAAGRAAPPAGLGRHPDAATEIRIADDDGRAAAARRGRRGADQGRRGPPRVLQGPRGDGGARGRASGCARATSASSTTTATSTSRGGPKDMIIRGGNNIRCHRRRGRAVRARRRRSRPPSSPCPTTCSARTSAPAVVPATALTSTPTTSCGVLRRAAGRLQGAPPHLVPRRAPPQPDRQGAQATAPPLTVASRDPRGGGVPAYAELGTSRTTFGSW